MQRDKMKQMLREERKFSDGLEQKNDMMGTGK